MSPARILVVEDELVVSRDVRSRLAGLGYEVAGSARAGDEAVRLAGELRPDLVLMDIRLGGAVDGVEAAQRIRDRFRLPVVYLTAYADDAALARVKATEPFGYLLKPFDERDLRAVVEMAVYKHRAETQLRDSERQFRQLFHANPHPMWVFDMETLRFLEVNHAAVHGYGYSRDEFLAMTIAGLGPPEEVSAMLEGCGDAGNGSQPGRVCRHSWKSGEIREVELTSHSVRYGARPARLVSALDVTTRRRAELELRRTANLLRAVADGTTDAVFVKDRDGRYLLFNAAASRFVGKPVAEVLGKDDTALFDRDSAQRVMAHDRRVMISAHPETAEETLTAAGVTRTYLATKAPYRDAAGTVIGLIGISRDITERKRAEEALVLFRALIDRTADGVEVVDPETGRFLDVNETACRAHGYTRDEYLALRVSDVDPFVAAQPWAAVLEGLRRSGFQPFESRHRRKDGSVFPVEVTLNHIRLDREYLVAVVRDITDRKRMEGALRRSEEMLRRSQAIAQVGGWIYSVEDEVFIGSDETNRLCGWGGGPHHLDQLFRLVPPEDVSVIKSGLQATLAGVPFEMEHRLVVAGRVRWVHVRAEREIDSTGRVAQIVGVMQDVTDRRNLEDQYRQAQKMEAIGRLAGGVAHDFNNLLTVISGYVGLALSQLAPTDQLHGLLVEVQRAGERAANLTRQLLAFSRKRVIQPRVIDLNALVGEVGGMLKRLIGADVNLDIVLDPDLDHVKVDPGQFEQVLMNLTVNARDAMPSGGTLAIETRNAELDPAACASRPGMQPGRYVQLEVRDTGHGMDADTRTRIFEPFFTTKEAGKGTGLGLVVVDDVVRQSGGYVEVHSEIDRGTTFNIYVPTAREVSETPGKPPPCRFLDSRGTETVLVVDNDDEVRTLVACVLRSAGYTVLEARDGAEALHVGRGHAGSVHLLLTGVITPRMNGQRLAEVLTATRPGLKVLYLSDNSENAIARPDLPGEQAVLLQKPFTPAALAREVRAVLDA